jgi:hypothetical protein
MLRDVTAQLGPTFESFEETRATAAESVGLSEWAEVAMANAMQFVAESNLSTMPQSVVQPARTDTSKP